MENRIENLFMHKDITKMHNKNSRKIIRKHKSKIWINKIPILIRLESPEMKNKIWWLNGYSFCI